MSQWNNALSGRAKTTKILIGINVLVYLAQLASGDGVTALLALSSESVFFSPWTMITSGFAHASWLHLAINMYSLWIFGEALEEFLGSKKFLSLYLLSILGGSVAYLLFSQGLVVGASGGVFGLMGAYFIVMRAMGFRSSQMLVLIGLNIFIGFTNPSTAITAHLGGLAAGSAIAWYYAKGKR
jgi:membrane associated rhomboid family serine protease